MSGGTKMVIKMAEKKENEMTVVTKAKELCAYVMLVTQKSPSIFALLLSRGCRIWHWM
jgi:hypothetical protein